MKRTYKRKLTLWFTGDTAPGQTGVFQVDAYADAVHKRFHPVMYSYWDGNKWGVIARRAELALAYVNKGRNLVSYRKQDIAWRGRTAP